MEHAAGRPVARRRWKVLLGSLLILVIAQALNGGLTLASLDKLYLQSLVTNIKVAGLDAVLKIEGAVRFGKPIEAFYGMQKLQEGIGNALPEVDRVALALPDGQAVYQSSDRRLDVAPLLSRARAGFAKGERLVMVDGATGKDEHVMLFAIRTKTGEMAGTLALAFSRQAAHERFEQGLKDNLRLLGLTTGAAALAIILYFSLLGRGPAGGLLTDTQLYALPILALIAAQAYYSVETIRTFRDEYTSVTRSSTERLTNLVKQDIESILGKGIKITSLVRVEDEFQRIIRAVPEIEYIEIRDAGQALLYKADQGGKQAVADGHAQPHDPEHDILLPLQAPSAEGTHKVAGQIRIHLSPDVIGRGVWQRMLDAGTLALLSALAVMELSILLAVLVRRSLAREEAAKEAAAKEGADDTAEEASRHMLARPAIFTFLLAWALPLSFIPLQMQSLYEPLLGLPRQMVLALPISLEMLCALVTALAAGALTDRRGWHVPVVAGLIVSMAGAFLSSQAESAIAFILCRGVVGLGYGFAWMGLQGFVFQYSAKQKRAQGISNLVAGIFSGHICGTAIGGMLAEPFGFAPVFLISAGFMLVPLAFLFLFMKPYMRRPHAAEPDRLEPAPPPPAGARAVLLDRNFIALLFLSVIPFSVAQVGLLYYSLPIYLAELGLSQSNIGRILMIYGLSVICVAPLLSRWVDRSPRKKSFIAAGGVVGGCGLLWLYANHGLPAMMLAVFLLGLGSCLAGGAQSAFALNLKSIQSYGSGKAMGFQRAADKLGQMLGPLVVGALFTSVGIETGLAVTGALYLAATLLFMVVAGERPLWSRLAGRTPGPGSGPGAG